MRSAVVALLVGLGAAPAIAAQRSADPDWPCQSVKVGELSAASIWSGPPIDAYQGTWKEDPKIAALAGEIAQRRVPIEQAQSRIADFAKQAGPDRQQAMLALFAGVFDTLDAERARVVAGLVRYGKRQKRLAANLRDEAEALRTAQAATVPDEAKVTQLTQQVTWDSQVFEARRQSLSAACDVPNIIEQRLGALARAIQQQAE